MADHRPHVRGNMDIREQQKTYADFWWVTQWSTIGIVLLLIVLAYFFT
jgi:hypothetical protein